MDAGHPVMEFICDASSTSTEILRLSLEGLEPFESPNISFPSRQGAMASITPDARV
jgi:hypothetical protein